MTITYVPRSETTAESLGPVVQDLFAAINKSKKLRGERLQVESIFESLSSLDPAATPEERAAAITGGLQQVRAQARNENAGFLQRIIDGLNPNIASFDGVTPIEKFMADQQLNLALQDPLIRRGREAAIASREAAIASSEASTEKGYNSIELGLETPNLQGAMDNVKASISLGASRTTDEFIQSFRNNVITNPTIGGGKGWKNLNKTKQVQLWNRYKLMIATEAQDDNEISMELAGQAVRDFETELFGTDSSFGKRPDGTQKGQGFLGVLPVKGGGVATEYSVGVRLESRGGRETDIPTLVPSLTKQEIDLMLNDIIPNGKAVPDAILQKAVDHANKRVKAGKDVFANEAAQAAAQFIPVGSTDAEMQVFHSGLIPEDREKFAAMQQAWNEARDSGDVADARYWEEAMSRIIEEAKRRLKPKTKTLPQEFPIGLGIPTLKRRSSARPRPNPKPGSTGAGFPGLRGL